jgi:hypothetical protein
VGTTYLTKSTSTIMQCSNVYVGTDCICNCTALICAVQQRPNQNSTAVEQRARWAESVPNATEVYLPKIIVPPSCKVSGDGNTKDNDNYVGLLLALKDRMACAASGVVISSFNHDK